MKERDINIDILKALAAFLVVVIHTEMFNGMGKFYEIFYYALEIISRTAVPTFFFLSGYYFYKGYKKKGDSLVKKYCLKLALIHIIAGCIYKIYIIFNEYLKNGRVDLSVLTTKQIMKEFLYNGFYYHLWYLPALIWGIIILWILIKIKKVKLIYSFIVLVYLLLAIFNENFFMGCSQEKILMYIGYSKMQYFWGLYLLYWDIYMMKLKIK